MNLQQHWQDLLDKDDRTSPEDHPDMVLISFDELAAIVAAERDDALKRAAEAAFQHIRSVGPNGIIGTIEDLKYSEPTVHQSLIKTHE